LVSGAFLRPISHSIHSIQAQRISRRHGFKHKDSCVQVLVRDNNVDQALKALKKKMQREGIFREMKLRGHYEKPSEKRAREKAEAVRRARKLARKKLQREGLLPMKPKPVLGARP
jgi:small subunit ribosomal protein S21